MTRTGTTWDVLAVVALLLPLASLAGRRWPVRGTLASVLAWVVLVVANAAPTIGRFEPDVLALVAAAGTVLVAAALASRATASRSSSSESLVAVGVGPAAAALCLGLGLVDQPDLGTGTATAVVAVAAGAAAVLCVAPAPARLFVPAVLLAGLRGSVELSDPVEALGLVLAAAGAVVAVALVPGRGRPTPFANNAAPGLALAALAVAAGPVPAARPAGALLVAGAVLLAAAGTLERRVLPPWALLAAAPGAAIVASALADVPSPGAPAVAVHVTFAALLVVVTGAAVVGVDRGPRATGLRSRSVEDVAVYVALGALTGWLAVAPGSWRWAVPDPAVVAAWDRAAAVAAAVAVAAAAVLGLLRRPSRPRRPGVRRREAAGATAGQ